MHSARLDNPCLKYQRVTPPDCKYVGIKQFEFVAKNQLLFVCFYLELLVQRGGKKEQIRSSLSRSSPVSMEDSKDMVTVNNCFCE